MPAEKGGPALLASPSREGLDTLHISASAEFSRQYLLGGGYLAFELQNPKPSQWRAKYYQEKAQMIRKFYQYVQENHQSNFKVKWSKWLKAHGNN